LATLRGVVRSRPKEGAKSIADRASDAVEDVIPGDSDKDGH